MSQPQQRMDKSTGWWGLFAGGLGLYIILLSLDLLPHGRDGMHAPPWVGVAAGLAFLFAGVTIMIQAFGGASAKSGELPAGAPQWIRLAQYFLGLVITAALATIGSWVAFGAGPRAFSSNIPFLSGEGIGRAVFGIGAIITWLFVIGFAVQGARKLRGQR